MLLKFAILSLCAATAIARMAYVLPDGVEFILKARNLQETFSCDNRPYGYYADVGNDCQIFHICLPMEDNSGTVVDTAQFTFVCGNGTIFSQGSLTCEYEYLAVPCEEAEGLYEDSNNQFGENATFKIFGRRNDNNNNFRTDGDSNGNVNNQFRNDQTNLNNNDDRFGNNNNDNRLGSNNNNDRFANNNDDRFGNNNDDRFGNNNDDRFGNNNNNDDRFGNNNNNDDRLTNNNDDRFTNNNDDTFGTNNNNNNEFQSSNNNVPATGNTFDQFKDPDDGSFRDY